MPKPTQAGLLHRFALAIVPSELEGEVSADKSVNSLTEKTIGKEHSQIAAPTSNFSDSASTDQTASVSVVQKGSSLNSSASPSPCSPTSLSFCGSSLGDPRSPSSSDDNDTSGWSGFESSDAAYRQMCTPKKAKALSIATGRFYAVSSPGRDGLVPGDEPRVDGMILHGYTGGKPIYYKYSGIHADLKAIETETIFGTRYVRQPVESCFSRFGEGLEEDSGYISLQESESTASVSGEVPPNRVFSNKWFKIGKSSLGGYGVFALRDIEPCTSILLERPFLRLRNYNTLRHTYEKLSLEEKAVFNGLHAFAKNQTDELMKRANANSFMCGGGEGIFAIASNFNHACHMKRNTQYHWDPWRRVMVFTTDRHVTGGEELLISYGEGRIVLHEKFGFLCNCGSCDGPMGWKIETFV